MEGTGKVTTTAAVQRQNSLGDILSMYSFPVEQPAPYYIQFSNFSRRTRTISGRERTLSAPFQHGRQCTSHLQNLQGSLAHPFTLPLLTVLSSGQTGVAVMVLSRELAAGLSGATETGARADSFF